MWKMKILSCVNLEAKLNHLVREQGPLSPEKAASLTLGEQTMCLMAPLTQGCPQSWVSLSVLGERVPPACRTLPLTLISEIFRLEPQ